MENVLFSKVNRAPGETSVAHSLEKLGDYFLSPANHVWETSIGRREVCIVDGKVTKNEIIQTYSRSHFLHTALCIALFIPSIIIGYVIKSLAQAISSEVEEDYRRIEIDLYTSLTQTEVKMSDYIKSLLIPLVSHKVEYNLENSVEDLFSTTKSLSSDLKGYMPKIVKSSLSDCEYNELLYSFENCFKRTVFFLGKLKRFIALHDKYYNEDCGDNKEVFVSHCFFDEEFFEFQKDDNFTSCFSFFDQNTDLSPFRLVFDTTDEESDYIPFFKAYSILIYNQKWNDQLGEWTYDFSDPNQDVQYERNKTTFKEVENSFLEKNKSGVELDFVKCVKEMKNYLKEKITKDFNLASYFSRKDPCQCSLNTDALLDLGF